MIAPHTLANFQSLTKLIALIINAPRTLANFQSLPKLITLIINAPHTLSNFQSLTKLIMLIINHFYHIVGAIGKSPSQNKTNLKIGYYHDKYTPLPSTTYNFFTGTIGLVCCIA